MGHRLTIAVLLLAGCSCSNHTLEDAGVQVDDAGEPVDGGGPSESDGGGLDAGENGGPVVSDAGFDAAASDAGMPDAGPTMGDAGLDASTSPADAGRDAGPDAGGCDPGPPFNSEGAFCRDVSDCPESCLPGYVRSCIGMRCRW